MLVWGRVGNNELKLKGRDACCDAGECHEGSEVGSVPSSWGMWTDLGVREGDLTVDLERWAGLTYTEQVGGACPRSSLMSKDLVFAQRLGKSGIGATALALPRREAGSSYRPSDDRLEPTLSKA